MKPYRNILLIDDNDIDNYINKSLLLEEKLSERVYVFNSGKSALEFLINIDEDPEPPVEIVPEVIFLDINMPIMDGFQFIEQYGKLSESLRNKMEVYMLTSSVNPSDEKRSGESGFIKGYLHKPLTVEEINRVKEKA